MSYDELQKKAEEEEQAEEEALRVIKQIIIYNNNNKMLVVQRVSFKYILHTLSLTGSERTELKALRTKVLFR